MRRTRLSTPNAWENSNHRSGPQEGLWEMSYCPSVLCNQATRNGDTLNTALILAEKIDPNGVTPGVVGFLITAAVAITSIFLILDMNRRMRRLRYREEAVANVDAEVAVDKLIADVDKETGNG